MRKWRDFKEQVARPVRPELVASAFTTTRRLSRGLGCCRFEGIILIFRVIFWESVIVITL